MPTNAVTAMLEQVMPDHPVAHRRSYVPLAFLLLIPPPIPPSLPPSPFPLPPSPFPLLSSPFPLSPPSLLQDAQRALKLFFSAARQGGAAPAPVPPNMVRQASTFVRDSFNRHASRVTRHTSHVTRPNVAGAQRVQVSHCSGPRSQREPLRAAAQVPSHSRS